MKKMRFYLSLFGLVLALLVGLACNLVSGGVPASPENPVEATVVSTLPPVEQPTVADLPNPTDTQVPVRPTKIPQPTATEAPTEFFTEEFDADPGDTWQLFVLRGNKTSDLNAVTTEFKDGQMVFDIDDVELYAYYLYQPVSYSDVRLDLQAENQGKNTNNISLVCRQDGNKWYEFSITSGGLWVLYAHSDNGYEWMANGGTKALNMGKDVNEFSMVCQGNAISMLVNGTDLKTVTDKKYNYDSGGVGFNISSLDVIPVTVGVDWIQVSQP